MVLVPTTFAARETAIRRHYYQPRRSILLASPVRVGSAFAFVVPTTYAIETQRPASGLHPHPTGHNLVVGGTEVLALVIFILVAGKVLLRVIRVEDGAVLH